MPLKNPLLFAAAGNNMEQLNQINLHQEDTPPVVHGFMEVRIPWRGTVRVVH
jgi:hypothetical protein